MPDPASITLTCRHDVLHFQSGGFYVCCHACGQVWVALKTGATSDTDIDHNASGAMLTSADERRAAALDGRDAGWLPIESAPRDGTWFLACATEPGWGATRIVRFDEPDDLLPIHGEGNIWPSAPTHWRPLPAPPARPQPAGEAT